MYLQFILKISVYTNNKKDLLTTIWEVLMYYVRDLWLILDFMKWSKLKKFDTVVFRYSYDLL